MPKNLFVYDYFYPAYQAGGPVQSLTNLTIALNRNDDIAVVCSAVDLGGEGNLPGIFVNQWTTVILPASEARVNVWYAKKLTGAIFGKCLHDTSCSIVYLNGMFSLRFVIGPLLRLYKSKIKVVLCPRGMLQAGALTGKSFKKKVFLAALKLSGLVNNITWHATNEEEDKDIRKIFGNKVNIIVAANIPKLPVNKIIRSEKTKGCLRLIYLSLIAEKKNLLQLIELINKSSANITLDIYGPVKDAVYWKKCEQVIAGGNGKIRYMGDRRPEEVQGIFSMYDAFILLTKGENFGHALYESLSAGRPIITSYFTPWNKLEQKNAGWNLDISDPSDCINKLELITNMDNELFNTFCYGAYEIAKSYYGAASDLTNYHKLFAAP
ncbi:MAG: glycosyltransferase [Ferruginibacter sp.]|nr:glycosyltransferase [Ferruginibacter sp.]